MRMCPLCYVYYRVRKLKKLEKLKELKTNALPNGLAIVKGIVFNFLVSVASDNSFNFFNSKKIIYFKSVIFEKSWSP